MKTFDEAMNYVWEKGERWSNYIYLDTNSNLYVCNGNQICYSDLVRSWYNRDCVHIINSVGFVKSKRGESERFPTPEEFEPWAKEFFYWWTRKGPFKNLFIDKPIWSKYLKDGIIIDSKWNRYHRMAAIIGLRMWTEQGARYLNVWRQARLAGYDYYTSFVLTFSAQAQEHGIDNDKYYLVVNSNSHGSIMSGFPVNFLKEFIVNKPIVNVEAPPFPTQSWSSNWSSSFKYDGPLKSNLEDINKKIVGDHFQKHSNVRYTWDFPEIEGSNIKELRKYFSLLLKEILD